MTFDKTTPPTRPTRIAGALMTQLTIEQYPAARLDAAPAAAVAGPDAGLAGGPGRPDRRTRHRRRVSAAQPRPWSVRQHDQPRRGAVIHRGRR